MISKVDKVLREYRSKFIVSDKDVKVKFERVCEDYADITIDHKVVASVSLRMMVKNEPIA